MDKKRNILITVMLLVLIVLVAFFGYSKLKEKKAGNPADTGQSRSVSETDNKPIDFKITAENGEVKELKSFRGKPTVINFWASWCAYCVQEMPDFQEVYNKYGKDVNFVMINVVDGQRETEETGKEFWKEKGYTMPLYFEFNHEATTMLDVYSFPTR